jgi:uncharacterized repeat protein (TIGR01451 family)
MRMEHMGSRWGVPRLLAVAGVALTLIVLGAVVSGGAGAAPGDADLAITKSDSPDPVTAGENLTYTIKVENPGTLPATETKVTDVLPNGVDYVSATSGICQRAGDTVTCDLGQVEAASTATVTIVVKTKKAGTLSNTAKVASPEDIVLENNSATAMTTVSKAPAKPKKPRRPKRGTPTCAAPTITGTAGPDTIAGTSRGDVIVTFGGNDQVFAGGGGDLICSGPGADLVAGQDGGDTIIGGGGADRLIGGKSGDVLKGKNGRDRLKGKSGDDFLNGGKKRDRCKGGSGRNTLVRCP